MDELSGKPPDASTSGATADGGGAAGELRREATNWTLDSEYKLMQHMEDLNNRLLNSAKEVVGRVDACSQRAGRLSVSVTSASNKFNTLANTQFMESRVHGDSEDNAKANSAARQNNGFYGSQHRRGAAASRYSNPPTKTIAETERERLEAVKQALQIMSATLDSELDITDLPNGELTYEIKDRYSNRPLPPIIGTAAFINQKFDGFGGSTARPGKDVHDLSFESSPSNTTAQPNEQASFVVSKQECDITEDDAVEEILADTAAPLSVPVAAPRLRRPSTRSHVDMKAESASQVAVDHASDSNSFRSSSPLNDGDDDRPQNVGAHFKPARSAARAPVLLFGDSGESDDEESPIFAAARSVITHEKNSIRAVNRHEARVSLDTGADTMQTVSADTSPVISAPMKKAAEREKNKVIPVVAVKALSNIPFVGEHSTVHNNKIGNEINTAIPDAENGAVSSKDAFRASLNATLGRRQQLLSRGSAEPTSLARVENLAAAAAVVSDVILPAVRRDADKTSEDNNPSSLNASVATSSLQTLTPPARASSSSGIASSTTSSASITSTEVSHVGRGRKPAALFDATDDEDDADEPDDLFAAISRRVVTNTAVLSTSLLSTINTVKDDVIKFTESRPSKVTTNHEFDKVSDARETVDAEPDEQRDAVPPSQPSSIFAGKSSKSMSFDKKSEQAQHSLTVNSIFSNVDSDADDDDDNDLFAALARKRSKIPMLTAPEHSSPTTMSIPQRPATRVMVNNAGSRVINDSREAIFRNDPDEMISATNYKELDISQKALQQISPKELRAFVPPVSPSILPSKVPTSTSGSLYKTDDRLSSATAPPSPHAENRNRERGNEDFVNVASSSKTNDHTADNRVKVPSMPQNLFVDEEDADSPGWASRLLVGSSEDSRRPLSLPVGAVSAFRRSPPPSLDAFDENEEGKEDLITPTATRYKNFWHDDDDRDSSDIPPPVTARRHAVETARVTAEQKSVIPAVVDAVPKLFAEDVIPFTDHPDDKTPAASAVDVFHSALPSFTVFDNGQPTSFDNAVSAARAHKRVGSEEPGRVEHPSIVDENSFDVPRGFYADEDDDKLVHGNQSSENMTAANAGSVRLSRSRSANFAGRAGSSRVSQTRLQQLLDRKLRILSKHNSPMDVQPASLNDSEDLAEREISVAPSAGSRLSLVTEKPILANTVLAGPARNMPKPASVAGDESLDSPEKSAASRLPAVMSPIMVDTKIVNDVGQNGSVHVTTPLFAESTQKQASVPRAGSSEGNVSKQLAGERDVDVKPTNVLILSSPLVVPISNQPNTDRAVSVDNRDSLPVNDNDAVFDPLRSNTFPATSTISSAVNHHTASSTAKPALSDAARQQTKSVSNASRKPVLFDADDDNDEDLFLSVANVASKRRQNDAVAISDRQEKSENVTSKLPSNFVAEGSGAPVLQQVAAAVAAKPVEALVTAEIGKAVGFPKPASRAVLHHEGEDDDLFATLSRKKPHNGNALPNGAANTNKTIVMPKNPLHTQPAPFQPVKGVPTAVVSGRSAVASGKNADKKPKSKSIFDDDEDGDDDDSDLFRTSVVKKAVKK